MYCVCAILAIQQANLFDESILISFSNDVPDKMSNIIISSFHCFVQEMTFHNLFHNLVDLKSLIIFQIIVDKIIPNMRVSQKLIQLLFSIRNKAVLIIVNYQKILLLVHKSFNKVYIGSVGIYYIQFGFKIPVLKGLRKIALEYTCRQVLRRYSVSKIKFFRKSIGAVFFLVCYGPRIPKMCLLFFCYHQK